MNCRKALHYLSLDRDGELDAGRRGRLEHHLAQCASCRAARDAWAGIGEQLRGRPVEPGPTPEAAWADVRRAIRDQAPAREDARAPVALPWLRWAAVAAGIVILAGGVVMYRMAGSGGAPAAGMTQVEWVETGLPGAAPMVYEDAESGLTVIWVVESNHKEQGHAGS